MYATVGYQDMADGRRTYRLVSIHETEEDAEEAADLFRPDYDPTVGMARLSHGAMTEELGTVGEVVYEGDSDPLDDWTILPDSLVEALAPYESEPEKWGEILEDNGYVILVDDDDPRFFLLVSI